MITLRRLRFWLGARLLAPHVRHMRQQYFQATDSQRANGNSEAAQNCQYITIGLGYAIDKFHRHESAVEL